MGHPNESESLFTVTIDQQGVLDLAISEEFLRNLGFTDPSIIAEIIRNLDDLVDEAKIKFCGDANVNSKCVSDVLEFLQLMSLNLEHIAKAGVMHPAMWKSDDPVRHLMPEKGRWSPLVGGAIDGGVESAMGIPILVSTLGQLIIFEDQGNAALQIFTAAGFDRLKEAVASEIVEVFTDGEKREYTIAKASVELALSYYVLLGRAAKGLNEVLEKVETLGNKLEKCPILRKYVQKSVDGKDVVRLKKFDDLAAELDAEKLETIFSKVDAEKLDDLLDDLSESVNFKTALANEPELVDVWKLLDDAGYTTLRRNPASLDKLDGLLKHPKLSDSGLDENIISDLIKGNRGLGAAALDDITKGLDDLVTSGAKFEDIGRLTGEFAKGGNFAKGARYIQRHITGNVGEFSGKRIKFEETFKAGETTRRVDVNVRVSDNSPIAFYEFKSTKTVPPENFSRQFINDLKLDDVSDLGQVKWYFDGSEISSLQKSDFIDALSSSKSDLFGSKARNLFEDYLDVPFTSADDMIANLRNNDEWFELIFQVK